MSEIEGERGIEEKINVEIYAFFPCLGLYI